MSKAMLIMDMPNNCAECLLCKRMEDNCYYCMATNQIIVDVNLKTHWCLLRAVPERIELTGDVSNAQKASEEILRIGYNYCLDDILGE